MATRVVHVVRCRSKANPQIYVDVEVLDAITFQAPDGTAIGMLINPKADTGVSVTPYIVDKTGDGNGVGDPNSCTRVSHMERMTSQSDQSQYIDVEILDAFNLMPPALLEGQDADATPGSEDESTPGGIVDSGDNSGAPHAFFTPLAQAQTYFVDKTGLGLQPPATADKASRVGHINLVTNAGNTDDNNQFSDGVADTVPPNNHQWTATVKIDGINFQKPGGNNICLIIPKPGVDGSAQDKIDTTKYVTDQYTGEPNSPPDNTDPNHYVIIPDDSSGSNLGSNPTSAQTGVSGPINQGPLWWIKKVAGLPNPWYWWAPIQTPLAWSFFGGGPGWGYRGPVLLNDYPVIWILSINNPLSPMGNFGASDLPTAATEGDWYNLGLIPSLPIWIGGLNAGEIFAPFGYLPVLDPPVGDGYTDLIPNIWELTGLKQPNLTNPNKPWDRAHNPYLWPNSSLWEQAANDFQENWNSVANGMNGALDNLVNGNRIQAPPPGWNWSVPYTVVHGGNPPASYPTWGSFQNGIQTLEVGGYAIPAEEFVPATVATLNVSQLDPKTWDTRASLVQDAGRQIGPYLYFAAPTKWSH